MYKSVFFILTTMYLFYFGLHIIPVNEHLIQSDDKILWSSNRKLKSDDFKGKSDTTNLMVGAITESGFEIIENHLEREIPKYIIESNFIKSKSWIRIKNNYVLAHEQLHFDISELFARKIRKSFDSLNIKKVKDHEVYNKIYFEYGKKYNNFQDIYDYEVYFDSIKQKRWIKKIAVELNKLKRYEYIK